MLENILINISNLQHTIKEELNNVMLVWYNIKYCYDTNQKEIKKETFSANQHLASSLPKPKMYKPWNLKSMEETCTEVQA